MKCLFILLFPALAYAQSSNPYEKVEPVVAQACNCYAHHVNGYTSDQTEGECLKAAEEQLEEVIKREPVSKVKIQLKNHYLYSVKKCSTEARTLKVKDLKAEQEAQFKTAYQTRLDHEDGVQLAIELAQELCACQDAAEGVDELSCREKNDLMEQMLDSKYKDNKEVMDQIYMKTMEILDQCN